MKRRYSLQLKMPFFSFIFLTSLNLKTFIIGLFNATQNHLVKKPAHSTTQSIVSYLVGCVLLIAIPRISFAALTLQQAINTALLTNPSIHSAAAQKNALNATSRVMRAELLPHLTLSGDKGVESNQSPVNGMVGQGIRLNRHQYSINASQLLFDGGRSINSFRASRIDRQNAQWQYQQTRVTVALNTVIAYYNVLQGQQLITLALENLNTHEHIQTLIEKKAQAGLVTRVNEDLMNSRLALAHNQLIQSQTQLIQARNNFEQIVGTVPNHLTIPSSIINKLPKLLKLRKALGQNPSLRAGQAQIQADKDRIKAAKGRFWPTINLQYGYTRGENLQGIKGPDRNRQTTINASYPLFNGGADKAALDEAESVKVQAIDNQEQLSRNLHESLLNEYINFKNTIKEVTQLQQYVKHSKDVLNGYEKQYQVGRRQLFNLLDAEGEYYQARTQLVQAKTELEITGYTLLADTGLLLHGGS